MYWRWALRRGAGARGAQAAGVASARGRRRLGQGARGAQEAGARGALSGMGARGAAGCTAWAYLCAWWECWLGQLGQFGFW